MYTKDAGKRQDALMQEIFSTYHISSMMEDIGYSCAETPASFRDILSQFPDLKEADVAQILGMMSRTHSSLEGNKYLYISFIDGNRYGNSSLQGFSTYLGFFS